MVSSILDKKNKMVVIANEMKQSFAHQGEIASSQRALLAMTVQNGIEQNKIRAIHGRDLYRSML
jgi:hypothetical protein